MERRRGPFHQVGRSNPPRCFVPRGWPPCLIYPRGCGTSVGLRQVSSASPGAAGITEGHTWWPPPVTRVTGRGGSQEPSPSPNNVLYHAGASHKSGQHSTTAPASPRQRRRGSEIAIIAAFPCFLFAPVLDLGLGQPGAERGKGVWWRQHCCRWRRAAVAGRPSELVAAEIRTERVE